MTAKEPLNDGFQLLHYSSARREDYESVSGSAKYLLYYCATCGVENKLVAECMKSSECIKTSLPKSKQPTSKSCKDVCDAMQDPFMILKLMFFSFVCGLAETYGTICLLISLRQ